MQGCGVLAMASLSLAACGKRSASAGHDEVTIGVSGRPDQAAIQLAVDRGYFGKFGITPNLIETGSGNDAIAPLARDQIQVANGSPNATFLNALDRKVDVRLLADYAHVGGPDDGCISILVRKDLHDAGVVKSPRDLKGRIVSLGASRGNYSYILMDVLLRKYGLTWDDIKVQNMGLADSITAMENKVVDAGFVIEPLVATAEKRGIATVLVKGGEVDPGAQNAVLFASPGFAANKDLAGRFMAAYLLGVRDYNRAFIEKKDEESAIALLTRSLTITDQEIWKRAMPQRISPNGGVNLADIRRQAEIYKRLGDLSGPIPDLEKYYDAAPLDRALKLVGRV